MNKNRSLILYILNKLKEGEVNTTKIVKLLYFFDLIYFKNKGSSISDYEYIRYHYGPYSSDIKTDIYSLIREDYITMDVITNGMGQDIQYFFPSEKLFSKLDEEIIKNIGDEEIEIMDKVLDDLGGLTASQLGDLTYKTAPMKKLGAVQGEKQGWEEKLDLSVF